MSGTLSYKEALKNAAVLCSKSEKCSSDLIIILGKSGLTPDEISTAIEYLKKEKFIDDKRFTVHYISDKFRLNKWGKVKIAYMLRQKHIEAQLIEESMATIPEDDYEVVLRDLLRSKAKSLKASNSWERKQKLAVYAQGRGFESDLAFRIAGEIIEATGGSHVSCL